MADCFAFWFFKLNPISLSECLLIGLQHLVGEEAKRNGFQLVADANGGHFYFQQRFVERFLGCTFLGMKIGKPIECFRFVEQCTLT